jgi:diguanylate cyclase (GGDEF)-like protein/PAS domain S-box-containing protein
MNATDVNHRQVIETSLDGYLHISRAGVVVDVNAAFCALSGYPREELAGLHISAFDSHALEANANATLVDGAKGRRFETILRRKDGTLWNADVSMAVADDNGQEMFGFFRDISDRKKIHAELREQGEFFRLITENLDGFVAVLDLKGVRVYNSPSYRRLLGPGDSAGTFSFLEIHPEDRERVEQAFQEVVTTGVGRHLEYRFMLPNHKDVRYMESRSGVIRDGAGKIKNVAVVSFDITERKAKDERVHDMAFNDVLTGLPNRRLMLDRLKQSMAASKRSYFYNALIFIDLDNFKPINDLHCHAVGDLLLIEVANRLKCLMRAEDTVARIGGDEFVVILSALSKDEAESASLARAIAGKICNVISQPYQLQIEADGDAGNLVEHHCSASVGIAMFLGHETRPDDILNWADRAMYQAKEAGRNAIRFHQPVN